jgi:hypothetical protein
VSLNELHAVRGQLGLPVDRDEHFDADKPPVCVFHTMVNSVSTGS